MFSGSNSRETPGGIIKNRFLRFRFYRYPICTRRSPYWSHPVVVVSSTYGFEENFENTVRPARFRALVFRAEFSWPTCRHPDESERHGLWRKPLRNRLPTSIKIVINFLIGSRLSYYNTTRTHIYWRSLTIALLEIPSGSTVKTVPPPVSRYHECRYNWTQVFCNFFFFKPIRGLLIKRLNAIISVATVGFVAYPQTPSIRKRTKLPMPEKRRRFSSELFKSSLGELEGLRNYARRILSRVVLLLHVCVAVKAWHTNTFKCTYHRPIIRVDRRKRYLWRRYVIRKFLLEVGGGGNNYTLLFFVFRFRRIQNIIKK